MGAVVVAVLDAVTVEPDLVRARDGSGDLGQYLLRWFGHSSFAIRSGTGTSVIADPNFDVTPGIEADAVTVSNDHYTHNNIDLTTTTTK